jgi:leucyl aminopeptidase
MDAKLPVRLRLLLPAVENAISANATVPATSRYRKGLTVEIGNTDAEGRVILCDALAFADEEKPDLLIELATLTGAARCRARPELPRCSRADEHGARAGRYRRTTRRSGLAHAAGPGTTTSCRARSPTSITFRARRSRSDLRRLFLQRFVTEARSWVHLDL